MRQLYEELIEELGITGQWNECTLRRISVLGGMMNGFLPSEEIAYKVIQKDVKKMAVKLQMERALFLGVEVPEAVMEISFPEKEGDTFRVAALLNSNPGIDFIANIIPGIGIKETEYSIEAYDLEYPYVLQASCEARVRSQKWKIEIDKIHNEPEIAVSLTVAGEKKGFTLNELFALVNLSEWESRLPDGILKVLESVYIEGIGIVYDSRAKQLSGMELTVGWDGEWEVFRGFSVSDIQLRLKNRYLVSLGASSEMSPETEGLDRSRTASYEAAVSGSFTLGAVEIPVTIIYNETDASLGIRIGGQEEAELTDLGMLSPMIGEVDLASILPEGVSAAKLHLEELNFTYGCKEKKTRRFTLGVNLQTNWKLFGGLELESLRLYYDKKGEDGRVLLEGILRIGEGEFKVSVEKDRTRCMLSGTAEKPVAVAFSQLAGAAGLEFPVGEMEFSLEMRSVTAVWDTEEKSFYMEWKEKDGQIFFHKEKTGYICGLGFFGGLELGQLPLAGDYTGLLGEPYIGGLYLVYLSGTAPGICGYLPDLNQYPRLEAGLSLLASYGTEEEVRTFVYHAAPAAGKKLKDVGESGRVESGREDLSAIQLNKTAGPLILDRISLNFADGTAWFLIDAGIQMKGFRLMLEGLGAGYGLSDRKIRVALHGLLLDIRSSAFTLEGNLLRKEENEYSGELLLKAGPFTLAVQGGYRKKGYASLYAWANMQGRIGGPPCFEVNGIGAGFGYNRRLYIPEVERLEECPLIQGMEADFRPGDMEKAFPPKEGAVWFGAGISFSSFRMIDSIAVLTAELGDDTAVNLLGRAELTVPFGVSPMKHPLARAVLYLKAGYQKKEGKIAVEAALAEGSYVLSESCVLRGQFAYYVWLNGDFVLTLGGYGNSYRKPAQYPAVTRLSLNWKLSSALNVEGSMYFALVPSGIMAGGELKLLFQAANIRAWLNVAVDIGMMWQPFAYELHLKVDIGVSVKLWICTIKVEVGCDLDIWGPDFTGVARIHLWFIRFSIAFGNAEKNDKRFISAAEFRKAFLQNPQKNSLTAESRGDYQGLTIRIENGLLFGGSDEENWKVSAKELELAVTGPVPNSGGQSFRLRTCRKDNGDPLVIRPVLKVVIEKDKADVSKDFLFTDMIGEVPAALWGGEDEQKETITAVIGKKITVAPGKVNWNTYLAESWQNPPKSEELPRVNRPEPKEWDHPEDSWEKHISRIDDEKHSERRREIISALGFGEEDISLKQTAADPRELFWGGITLAATGVCKKTEGGRL